jgi:hypothetical protein
MRKEAMMLLALLALAGQARAESFEIKVKPYPSKGKSFAVKTTDQLDASQTEEEKGKPAKTLKASTLRTEEFTQTTLTVEEAKLVSFQRVYASSTLKSDDKPEKTPLDGKTVKFTLEKAACKHDLKDTKLSPEDDKKLIEAHTDGLVVLVGLLPEKAVNEGDEWPLTGKQVVRALPSIPADPERSRGKGKLVKVEKKDGVPVGTIEIEIDLETVSGPEGGGKGKFVILAETPIDGSSTRAKLTIKGSLTLEGESKGTKTRVVAGGEFTAEVSEEK